MTEDLSDLRAKIDAIDNDILELLKQRMAIVKEVGKRKSQTSNNLNFIRSGREAVMLRELTSKAEEIFPPAAIATMWRMIISTSLTEEQDMTVHCFVDEASQSCYWLAREYYGSFVDITCSDNVESIIRTVAADKNAIGILPVSSATPRWWHRPKGESNNIFIFAKIPFITTDCDKDTALAIANIMPEKTGEDVAVLTVCGSIEQAMIMDRITALGKTGNIIVQSDGCMLVEINSYLDNDSPFLQELSNAFEDTNVRLLGNYARPIAMES